MDWRAKYKDKIVSAEEAVSHIKGGEVINPLGDVTSLFGALAERVKDIDKAITLNLDLIPKDMPIFKAELADKVIVQSNFFGAVERGYKAEGRWIECLPMHLSDAAYNSYAVGPPDAVIMVASPPDENGYVSFGINGADERIIDAASLRIVQINENFPYVKGEGTMYRLDDFSYIVDLTEDISFDPPAKESSEEEKRIAEHVMPYIKDGSCIQLGIGGVANAVGSFLKEKKHLGLHTEMFVDAMVDLIETGAVDNSQKKFDRGTSIFGFAGGTEKIAAFLKDARSIEMRPFTYVNDPAIISQFDDFLSINGTMSVDLFGQCYSESVGFKQFSGTGGQVDFVRGARHSKGGHSFICLPSVLTKKDGSRSSKIVLNNAPGTIVTTLRTDVQYVATEFGVAYLVNESVSSRAKKLIALAHPDFRDELTFQAREVGLII